MANHEATQIVDFSPLQWTCSTGPTPVLNMVELEGDWRTVESQFLFLDRKLLFCYTFYGQDHTRKNCQALDQGSLTWVDFPYEKTGSLETEMVLLSINETSFLYLNYNSEPTLVVIPGERLDFIHDVMGEFP